MTEGIRARTVATVAVVVDTIVREGGGGTVDPVIEWTV